MRRSCWQFGIGRVFLEEFEKFSRWSLAIAKGRVDDFAQIIQGTHGKTPEEIERENRVREAKREYEEAAAAAMAEQKKAERERVAELSHWQQLKANLHSAKESMKASFSTNAGVVLLIRHCAAAHAAEVAIEQGIDVKSVQVKTETSAVEGKTKVVGYIDAPSAREEEVMMFAEKLQRACPAARMHGNIEWRHVASQAVPGRGLHSTEPGSSDSGGFSHGLHWPLKDRKASIKVTPPPDSA